MGRGEGGRWLTWGGRRLLRLLRLLKEQNLRRGGAELVRVSQGCFAEAPGPAPLNRSLGLCSPLSEGLDLDPGWAAQGAKAKAKARERWFVRGSPVHKYERHSHSPSPYYILLLTTYRKPHTNHIIIRLRFKHNSLFNFNNSTIKKKSPRICICIYINIYSYYTRIRIIYLIHHRSSMFHVHGWSIRHGYAW